jgi:hypothetical protein
VREDAAVGCDPQSAVVLPLERGTHSVPISQMVSRSRDAAAIRTEISFA